MTTVAYAWSPTDLAPVRVVHSRRVTPRLVPPAPVKRLANAVGTPVFDRLAWERGGDPLDPGHGRPSITDVIAGMVVRAGAPC